MTNGSADTPSDVVGARVRDVRERRRGWTREQLAERCAAKGAAGMTASVISDIETGRKIGGKRRRQVSVDELLALAAALNCPPVMLLTPDDDGKSLYQVTPSVAEMVFAVRGWIRGAGPIGGDDPREYVSLLPVDEFYTVQGGVSVQQRFLGWGEVKPGAEDEQEPG